MEWYIVLVLVLASPVILLAVAYVWYLCFFGIYAIARDALKRRAATWALETAGASAGLPQAAVEKPATERMYIVCQRCSKTVDAGRDGRYREPVFVPGYCRECAAYLVKRAKGGEREPRLEGAVLIGIS